MERPRWVLAAVVIGLLGAFGVLLAPATGAPGTDAILLPAILPFGFYAAGLVAGVLVPGHPSAIACWPSARSTWQPSR